MRRSRPPLALAFLASVVALSLAPATFAKFGLSKTKINLTRTRPPQVGLLGQTATVEVTTRSRRVSDRHLDLIRTRIEEAVRAGGAVQLVETSADNVVRVSVDDLEARVDNSIVYEDKYVQTGTKEEWNEKKKRMETKPVYGYRKEPVRVSRIRGRATGRMEVTTPLGQQTADVESSYEHEFKGDVQIPSRVASEGQLESTLIDELGDRAAAVVASTPETVEALLAVDGELKDGNRLAQAGLWKEALGSWSARTFKGDKEAARLHNVGVAHEALAYTHPLDSPEHRAALDAAAEAYRRALALDPGEKYFGPPNDRIQQSLGHAQTAQRLAADAQSWRDEEARRKAAATSASRPTASREGPAPQTGTAPTRRPARGRRAGIAPPAAAPAASAAQGRIDANERAIIADIRVIISAEAAYSAVNNGYYGELRCLAEPSTCLKDYAQDAALFLDEDLASTATKRGYIRRFHAGPKAPAADGRLPAGLKAFAYTAVPESRGQSGVRAFCGDGTGTICMTPDGRSPAVSDGQCVLSERPGSGSELPRCADSGSLSRRLEPSPAPDAPAGAAGGPRASRTGAVRVGGNIPEPRRLSHVPPAYPDSARQARIQGVVVLEAMIGPTGQVEDVKVVRGVHPLIDQAAIDAVRQWVYAPTLLDGKPVPVIMTVTVNFRLS